jgi:hypothetical protein
VGTERFGLLEGRFAINLLRGLQIVTAGGAINRAVGLDVSPPQARVTAKHGLNGSVAALPRIGIGQTSRAYPGQAFCLKIF